MSFICHIHNYTVYNQQWNVFSAFNPSKCTHTWSSGQPTQRRPGSSWGFGALLKGLTSVEDNSCQSRHSNPQPRVTSATLYPLEPRLLPYNQEIKKIKKILEVKEFLRPKLPVPIAVVLNSSPGDPLLCTFCMPPLFNTPDWDNQLVSSVHVSLS